MPTFFRIRAGFDNRRGKNLHPVLGFSDDEACWSWQIKAERASSLDVALSLPTPFGLDWTGSRKQQLAGVSDWPANVFFGPVCSKRMWDRVAPLNEAVWWISLPDSGASGPSVFGVLNKVPVIDLDNPVGAIPHLFRSSHPRASSLVFVSEDFKAAAELGPLHGVEFTPFDLGLGKGRDGWRRFLNYPEPDRFFR